MGVCTCVVSQFTFVSRLCSSMGVSTCVVSPCAPWLVDCVLFVGSSVYLCCESVSLS